jgi:hypothetical protein
VFAFIGFMVGNLAYVVSTGLFFKLFVCEFLFLCITKNPIYSDNRDIGAFVHCYHANSLSYLVLYDLVPERMWVLRRFLGIINLYSKYYVLIAYGLYYYTVLGFFLVRLWQEEKHEFLWPLVVANVMSIFTSYAVFYVVRDSESLAREAAVEPAPSRSDRPAEFALAESDTEPFGDR